MLLELTSGKTNANKSYRLFSLENDKKSAKTAAICTHIKAGNNCARSDKEEADVFSKRLAEIFQPFSSIAEESSDEVIQS